MFNGKGLKDTNPEGACAGKELNRSSGVGEKDGVRDIERCMLDLTWKEKQMGRGASEVE